MRAPNPTAPLRVGLLLFLFPLFVNAQNLLDGALESVVSPDRKPPSAIGNSAQSAFLQYWYSPTEAKPVLMDLPEGPVLRFFLKRDTFLDFETRLRYREYVAGMTTQPLKRGFWYRLKFEMKPTPEANEAMMDMQVHFRQEPIVDKFLGTSCLSVTPQLNGDRLVTPPNQFDYRGTWQEITEYYRAEGGEQHLIFGLFCDYKMVGHSNMSGKVIDVPENPWAAAYYLRNIVLEEIPPPDESLVNPIDREALIDLHDFQAPDLLFATNGYQIETTEEKKLAELRRYLQANEGLALEITGYTDQTGDSITNALLSQRRAQHVTRYFVANGIVEDRLVQQAKGSQEAFPLYLGETFLQRDRKVGFRFLFPDLSTADLLLLEAFTKAYGYVHYFSPNPELEHLDWNAFAVYGVNRILTREEDADPGTLLRKIFQPIVPDLFITSCPELSACLAPRGKRGNPNRSYLAWQYRGLASEINPAFASQLVKGVSGEPDESNRLFEDFPLGDAVTTLWLPELKLKMVIPLTIGNQTSRGVSARDWNNRLLDMPRNRRAERIASATIVWNIVQHFYPYRDKLQLDWEESLEAFLQTAAVPVSEDDYAQNMRVFLARLQDGHGKFIHRSASSQMFPKLKFSWVDSQLFVRKTFQHDSLEAGDAVILIDGKNAVQEFKKEMAAISGSEQWKIGKAERGTGVGPSDSWMDITVKREENLINTRVQRVWLREELPEALQEVEEGVYYLQLLLLHPDSLLPLIPLFEEKAKALIVDARGYPPIGQSHSDFLEHFLSEADTAQWIYSPKIIYPNQKNIQYTKGGWNMRPRAPQLSTRLVFLADGNSISACESYLALVQHYQLGTIIGDYTAGANGGANRIILPGGYRFYWTGEYVTLPDGTYYHAQGIQPDILCRPSWEDIRTGKDTMLERAMRFLREGSAH